MHYLIERDLRIISSQIIIFSDSDSDSNNLFNINMYIYIVQQKEH